MPENLYFKLLKDFETTGLSSRKSISPFMEKHFKKPIMKELDFDEWNRQNKNAHLFLQDVRHTGHFDFDEDEDFDVHPGRWFDVVDIHARITIAGLAYLDAIKANEQSNKFKCSNSCYYVDSLINRNYSNSNIKKRNFR